MESLAQGMSSATRQYESKKYDIFNQNRMRKSLTYQIISIFSNDKNNASMWKYLVKEMLPDYEFGKTNVSQKIDTSVCYSDSLYQRATLFTGFLYR